MTNPTRLMVIVAALLIALGAWELTSGYRLVSDDYGFAVRFPAKPAEKSSKNYEGLPMSLWTWEDDSAQEFFSAEATSYKEPLNPAGNWIPAGRELSGVGVQIIDVRRFTMHSPRTGRDVLAIETTGRQILSGDLLETIWLVDERTLISVTARTHNQRQREAFLKSLSLLR
ncbi:MAG TPA: hypothetical protein VJS11_14525 [Acidobacteriaceae bacterium]|nr:hypothetical protein [Acidobacteriaceae bacterium]